MEPEGRGSVVVSATVVLRIAGEWWCSGQGAEPAFHGAEGEGHGNHGAAGCVGITGTSLS